MLLLFFAERTPTFARVQAVGDALLCVCVQRCVFGHLSSAWWWLWRLRLSFPSPAGAFAVALSRSLCLFVSRLSEGEHRNSVMWVHDYHLMLLPKLLSDREKEVSPSQQRQRQTSIIFFLHIPFPTSQIFRYLAV